MTTEPVQTKVPQRPIRCLGFNCRQGNPIIGYLTGDWNYLPEDKLNEILKTALCPDCFKEQYGDCSETLEEAKERGVV
jgi:hypothetical protein